MLKYLANLAVSDIIHAGIVLPIPFKNLSVQNQEIFKVSILMLNNYLANLAMSDIIHANAGVVLSILSKNLKVHMRIRIFMGIGINHEMYNVCELMLSYYWPTLR